MPVPRGVKNITNQRFGLLIALGFSHMKVDESRNGQRRAMWRFQCDCGIKKTIRGDVVTRGDALSCGAYYHRNDGRDDIPIEALIWDQFPPRPIEVPVMRMKPTALTKAMGLEIRHLREARGWTRLDLSARLGNKARNSQASQLERGMRTSLNGYMEVCRVFDVPFWELVCRAQNVAPVIDRTNERIAFWIAGG